MDGGQWKTFLAFLESICLDRLILRVNLDVMKFRNCGQEGFDLSILFTGAYV